MANVINAQNGIVSTADSTSELNIQTGGVNAISIGSGQTVTISSVALTNFSAASATITTGNLAFTGTGQRITGDMSNATIASRLMLQTSTANTATIVGVLPNGTGTESRLSLFNGSDTANSSAADIRSMSTEVMFRASITGTGTYLPMTFYTNNAEKARLTTTGNLLVGTTTDVSGVSGAISDIAGNLRAVPRSGTAKTAVYTLAITDIGEYIELGTGGAIDVPNGIFSTGDVISVFNNTTGARPISLTITTAYIGGTDADKASVSLATRGVATILFISNSVCVVTGNVS